MSDAATAPTANEAQERPVDDPVIEVRDLSFSYDGRRVLEDVKGNLSVACDPVGVPPGKWVFTVSGSAARYAAGDFKVHTDLTIAGIIDHWDTED